VTTALVIGLCWLVSTGALVVVVGRAIRAADRADDADARTARRSRSRTSGSSAAALPEPAPPPSAEELEQWFRTGWRPPADRGQEPPEDAG
jgi:hypothetical protein